MKLSQIKLLLLLPAWVLLTTCEKTEWAPLDVDNAAAIDQRTTCDPCEGDLIFGPETFVRNTGRPVGAPFLPPGQVPGPNSQPMAVHRIFNMGEEADICLTVANHGVAAATITLDGQTIFTPANFTQTNMTLQLNSQLLAGTHELTVTMLGKPNGWIEVEMRGCITTPPPPLLCSEVARMNCEARGWVVMDVFPLEGILYCTIDGRSSENNCDTCGGYNIYVWKDGAGDHFCPGIYYSTLKGQIRGGHIPCECDDNLFWCWYWDMQDCIPDF
ncbi:MAG: hypothetical protein JNK77_15145 [Saprospiraceae bacterium]|nr:hypothetical protein [Saprospiraceae bacterium]